MVVKSQENPWKSGVSWNQTHHIVRPLCCCFKCSVKQVQILRKWTIWTVQWGNMLQLQPLEAHQQWGQGHGYRYTNTHVRTWKKLKNISSSCLCHSESTCKERNPRNENGIWGSQQTKWNPMGGIAENWKQRSQFQTISRFPIETAGQTMKTQMIGTMGTCKSSCKWQFWKYQYLIAPHGYQEQISDVL